MRVSMGFVSAISITEISLDKRKLVASFRAVLWPSSHVEQHAIYDGIVEANAAITPCAAHCFLNLHPCQQRRVLGFAILLSY